MRLHGAHDQTDDEPAHADRVGQHVETGEDVGENHDAEPGADDVFHDVADACTPLLLDEEEPEHGEVQHGEGAQRTEIDERGKRAHIQEKR